MSSELICEFTDKPCLGVCTATDREFVKTLNLAAPLAEKNSPEESFLYNVYISKMASLDISPELSYDVLMKQRKNIYDQNTQKRQQNIEDLQKKNNGK